MEFASRDDVGHFQVTAEAFRHWDADGEVPATCSRCHSAGGLPFFVEHGVTIKSEPSQSLECSTCHDWNNDFDLYAIDEVTFPSGAVVSFGEGDENNLCMTCHQGRESTVSVNNAIARAGVGVDEVATSLTFRNVHYFAAGATLFGTEAKGAYEFAEQEYNGRFLHVEEAQVCSDCHEAHTGVVLVNTCEDCHEDVESPEDVRFIRQEAEDVEPIDYDGDGDVKNRSRMKSHRSRTRCTRPCSRTLQKGECDDADILIRRSPTRTSSTIPTATARWTKKKRTTITVSSTGRRTCWAARITTSSRTRTPVLSRITPIISCRCCTTASRHWAAKKPSRTSHGPR